MVALVLINSMNWANRLTSVFFSLVKKGIITVPAHKLTVRME